MFLSFEERRFRDSKDDRGERTENKAATYDSRQRDEKPRGKGDGKSVWGHDGFLKMEAEPPPPVRKRPAFREKKILVETDNPDKATVEPARSNHSHRPLSISERREERDRNPRHVDRPERPAAGNRGVTLHQEKDLVVMVVEITGEERDSATDKVITQVVHEERNGSMICLTTLIGVQPRRTKRIKLQRLKHSWRHRRREDAVKFLICTMQCVVFFKIMLKFC